MRLLLLFSVNPRWPQPIAINLVGSLLKCGKQIGGSCKNFIDCPVVVQAFHRHGVKPVICGTNRNIVCCPKNETSDEPCHSNRISCQSMNLN